MAIQIPRTLKLSHLKSLAFQCGISTSGTKTLLTNRLISEINPIIPNHGSETFSRIRVLSIDMGIRNLAYCVLDLPSNGTKNATSLTPEVKAWRRLAVSSVPIQSQNAEASHPAAKEAFDPQTLS